MNFTRTAYATGECVRSVCFSKHEQTTHTAVTTSSQNACFERGPDLECSWGGIQTITIIQNCVWIHTGIHVGRKNNLTPRWQHNYLWKKRWHQNRSINKLPTNKNRTCKKIWESYSRSTTHHVTFVFDEQIPVPFLLQIDVPLLILIVVVVLVIVKRISCVTS